LLVRFQPVASDMRQVISAMKISTSLERIADQSVTTRTESQALNASPAISELNLLGPNYHLALSIFRDHLLSVFFRVYDRSCIGSHLLGKVCDVFRE
jgi:hypothetical protein